MIFKIFALLIMFIFYIIYIYKLVNLNKQGIKTNQAGKGNKTKKVIIIEKIMSLTNIVVIFTQLFSILIVEYNKNIVFEVVAIIFGILSIIFFLLATITMRNNWRVGIPEEKTSNNFLITANSGLNSFLLIAKTGESNA